MKEKERQKIKILEKKKKNKIKGEKKIKIRYMPKILSTERLKVKKMKTLKDNIERKLK